MSQRELEAVIGRAILDQEFRMSLFANPTAVLAGYELTQAEMAALRMVDAESLDACGGIGHRIRLGPLRSDENQDMNDPTVAPKESAS